MTSTSPKRPIERIGIQLFTLAALASRDIEATLKLIAESGYREVELFGPYPFSPPDEIAGWQQLASQMGIEKIAYFGLSVAELKARLDHYGLSTPSAHVNFGTARTRMPEMAEAARVLGHQYVVIPSARSETLDTLDDYRRLAAGLNAIGEQAASLGLRFGYHNHGYEQAPIDGRVPIDVLIEETDPALVAFELDIFWMIVGGGDPAAALRAHPGRFELMHVKDMAEQVRFSGRGQTPQEWMAVFPLMRDAGDGVLNLPHLIAEAHRAGVRHFFLERDLAADPERTLSASFRALAAIDLDG